MARARRETGDGSREDRRTAVRKAGETGAADGKGQRNGRDKM